MIFNKEEFSNKKKSDKMKILIKGNPKNKNPFDYLSENNTYREKIISNMKNNLNKSYVSDEELGFSVHYHSVSYDLN
jgi:hypothetical protein